MGVGLGAFLGPGCPAESEFIGLGLVIRFCNKLPDACSALELNLNLEHGSDHPLNFPDGETRHLEGKRLGYSHGAGRGAKLGLLMLPAQVSCLIGHAFCNVEFSVGTHRSILWQELSETSILYQRFRPSQLYWKEGGLLGYRGVCRALAPTPRSSM